MATAKRILLFLWFALLSVSNVSAFVFQTSEIRISDLYNVSYDTINWASIRYGSLGKPSSAYDVSPWHIHTDCKRQIESDRVLFSPSCRFLAANTGTQLSVDDKLARYLLNTEHEVGASKAKWFEEALGFTKSNAGDLAKQLVFDPAKAVQTAVTEYGTKYNQIIDVLGANGRTIPVKVAWIRNNDGVVRIVTAVPGN